MLETADVSPGTWVQTANLPSSRRSVFGLGAASLLRRPIVAIAGARIPSPAAGRLACLAARAVARAGFAVAAVAQTTFGRTVLSAAVRAGGPIVGMLHTELKADFAPPVPAPAGAALWLSIFGSRGWLHEGPDAADRVLGALCSAVVVADADGLPDAFYVAEAALHAGRPVQFSRVAAACWPTSLDRPGVRLGSSRGAVVRLVAGLRPVSAAVAPLSAATPRVTRNGGQSLIF